MPGIASGTPTHEREVAASTYAPASGAALDSSRRQAVVVRMPAKVNVHLGIHPGHDARGYHRADSIMVAVGLYDEVVVRPTTARHVSYQPPLGVAPERTATWRAVSALASTYDIRPNVSVAVKRSIPSEGGLGSASADAGAVLCACCALWGIDRETVRDMAGSIGADVPFFLSPAPSRFEGNGDMLVETYPSFDAAIALVRPNGGVGTAAAYAEFDRAPTAPDSPAAMRRALERGDVGAIARAMSNNLAPASARLLPEIGTAIDFASHFDGVLGAQLSGSGSCVFALCESDADAQRVCDAAARKGWWSHATRTVDAYMMTPVVL